MAPLSGHELFITIVVIIASVLFATSAPLLTYSVGLVCFGFMHIVREIYFIDHRFGARMRGSFACTLGALLSLVVLVRAATVFRVAESRFTYPIELALVVMLALSTLFFLPRGHAFPRTRGVTAAVVLLLGFGFTVSPSFTIVTLSVLHNLTPLGFMVEIAKPAHKFSTFLWCVLVFIFLPLLIAFGFFNPLAEALGQIDNLRIFPTGPLEKHLGVFLPGAMRAQPFATQAFSAVVFAQCMHYLAVIYIMPKMVVSTKRPLLPWPESKYVWLAIAIATLLLIIMYARDFFFARSVYGIAAALHAYLEIPLLLWAFALPKTDAPKLIPLHERSSALAD